MHIRDLPKPVCQCCRARATKELRGDHNESYGEFCTACAKRELKRKLDKAKEQKP